MSHKTRVIHEPIHNDWWGIPLVMLIGLLIAMSLGGCATIRQDQREQDAIYIESRLHGLKWTTFTMTNDYRVLELFNGFTKNTIDELRGHK